MQRLQIRILLGEIAEGAVHLEADLQIRFGVMDIAEQSFIATHVVIIDWLFKKRDGAGYQELFGLGGLAELMKAEPGMEKSSSGIGRDAAKFLTDAKGERPFLFSHQMMEAKLKHFGAVLMAFVDCVEFRQRLACHA